MGNKTLIIAEAGVNHNGDLDLAFKLAKAAKDAGADIVKFQTAVPKEVMTIEAKKAIYQKELTGNDESQLEMAEKIHLPLESFFPLIDYCKNIGIEFLTTPFDPVSFNFVKNLNLNYFKIPSGEITNYPYLRDIGQLGTDILLSTGMTNLSEIEMAIDVLTTYGTERNKITILHCNTEYPTPFNDVNLRAMNTIQKAFKMEVGYSDHTIGIEVPIAAVALGAKVIEKHFTLDRNLQGPDHKASLVPIELEQMIKAIRNIEKSLGDGIKRVSNSESKNMEIARKSIVAKIDINEGEIFSEKNLTVKRPGDGINPMMWNFLIGMKAIKYFQKDEKIIIK